VGYQEALSEPFELAADRVLVIHVLLSPSPHLLGEITVVDRRPIVAERGGYFGRRAMGIGHFIGREEIERRAPRFLTDLLRGIPGIVVRDGDFRLSRMAVWGQCAPTIVLNNGAYAILRMELSRVGGGEAELAMELEEHHFNPQRIVHGGIISALADTAIGLALRSILAPGSTHRTAQLNVHFLAKGEGNRLVGRGRAVHLGSRMGYGEGEVVDAGGKLLARATATFIVLPAPGAF
jgi:uncharacterized protein (TIGR00369 family)